MDALSSIFTWLSDHEAGISAVVGITVLAGIVFAGVRSLLRRADRGFERGFASDKSHSIKSRGAERLSLIPEPPLAELAPTMVGREDQEARMRSVFETAAQGHARLLCLTGEPGIGKTTLTRAFLGRLRNEREPCLIARGRCSERLAGTEAYLPVMEMFESLLRSRDRDQLAETMKQLAPTWYFRIAPLAADDSSDSRLRDDARAASQERMKRELLTLIQALSRRSPIVFFFDDVHWADASTVDLLAYLGARGDGLCLLTIATYRPSELFLADHPFVGLKRELQARGACEEIALGFLQREDISSYLDLEFPGHAFPDTLVDLVHARTDGSPLFMVNVIRYLQDSGAIVERDGWRLVKPFSEIEKEVPESIRSMIERKIDQLEEADRHLLIVASVQGLEFHAAVVAEAMEADEAEIEESLERLDQIHAFVRRVGEEEMPDGSLTLRYRFVHALYQNALYETLTPTRRAKMSATVANALVHRHGEDISAIAGELGMLFEAARDFARASDSFLQAARKAIRVYANQEAVELCRRSIENAKKLEGNDRESRVVAAAFELAHLRMTISRFEDAVESFGLAERAAEAAGLTEELIRAICGKGMSFFNLHRIDEMRAAGERAMELARSINSTVGVASAELVLACQRVCFGKLGEAERLFDRAIPELQEAGLQMQALEGVIYRGALHVWRQEYDDANRILRFVKEKAREAGSGFNIAGAHFFHGIALGNQGQLGEAMESLAEGRRLAELNQEKYWLPRLPNTVAWLHRELGDPEKSHLLNLENVELAREFGMGEGEANAHVNLAVDYMDLGEPARAHEHLQEAESIFDENIWFRWRYNIRLKAAFARHWILQGDLDAARGYAEASEEAARAHGDRKYRAWARKTLAEIALLLDDADTARTCLDEAIGILTGHPCPTIGWKILSSRAELATQLGDAEAADEFRGRARATIQGLADSVTDDALKTRFLNSPGVRRV
jgi:tetratricopeptide (TPR) repeat protein